MEGSGPVGSECTLVRVQAGWDVVIDVVKNQFLKTLNQNGGECHRAVDVQTSSVGEATLKA